jgi:hypothetical protein
VLVTGGTATGGTGGLRDDLAKVQIERDHDPVVGSSLYKGCIVISRRQADFAGMHDVVPVATHLLGNLVRHIQVELQAHRRVLCKAHILSRQPSGIGQRLTTIPQFDFGIIGKDLVGRNAFGDELDKSASRAISRRW